MSIRPAQKQQPNRASIVEEINMQRQISTTIEQDTVINATDHLEGLNETERSAAQLGVSPDEWKPISFLNQGHYETLLKGNALSGNLAQKLEAYQKVASGE